MIRIIPGKHLGAFGLMPAAPGTCPECAVDHPPELPHNQQSLFYQYKFYNDHGRWPTWEGEVGMIMILQLLSALLVFLSSVKMFFGKYEPAIFGILLAIWIKLVLNDRT